MWRDSCRSSNGSGVYLDFLTVVEVGQFVEFVVAAAATDVPNRCCDADEEDESEQNRHSTSAFGLRLVFLGFDFDVVLGLGFEFRIVIVVGAAGLAKQRGTVGWAELETVVQVDLEEGKIGHTTLITLTRLIVVVEILTATARQIRLPAFDTTQ